MSDTVKLIVTLSKGQYENLKNIQCGSIGSRMIVNAVMNGIPLDDVKAEIDKAQEPYKTSTAYDEGVRFGLMLAYQIVDKYKAESEDK